ncbi:hypothetical protein SLS55_002347 [Diplodia seriata]|uniref:Galactose oxidase kelch beta-propeller n=1 Tax=Diplodia seriata TaxID=420778 RepID=A0ABR3CRY0_9PEZI
MDSPRLFDPSFGLFLLLLAQSVHAQLPYHPTRLFRSSKEDGLVYIFGPATSAPNQAQLRSIDVTSSLDPASLNYTTLYSTLPWSSAADAVPYIPVVEADGNFTVYAGACTDSAQDAKTWTFEIGGDGNGTWSQADVVLGDVGQSSLLAPSFLAGGLSFSSSEDGSNSSLFVFGGMCPYAAATQDDWQGSANYSNTMLQLGPDSTTQFSLNVAPTRGPPVAEAGFALVGLAPTYSNGDNGSRDQQQNFVLIGGHTQTAYINMSQVALYSLPQATWTFLGVDQPTQEHTDLAKRNQVTEVEPRSGHTALLTADGSKIIVFGGWVGDVNTPADPQLAILNVGEGYGGDGSWEWTVPTTTGSGLANGGGIYGHGAVMLSGDVMMVAGGYSISSTSSRLKSRADLAQNTQSLFFNVTSNTWLSEYQPNSDTSSDSSDSSPSKAGLGAGLGIGLAAVLAMTIFYFWYKRYLRKKREVREKQIERDFSRGGYGLQGNEPYDNGGNYSEYLNDREAAALAVDPWFLNNRLGWKNQQSQEAERTGLLVEIPSPTRGLRRSLNGRAYHQAPRYDDSRMNQGSGNIHPIDEEDEIESVTNERTGMPEMSERPRTAENRFSTLSSASYTPTPGQDPFLDPDPLRSHPVPMPQNVVHFPTSLKSSGKQPVIQPGPSSVAQARIADVRSVSPNWELVANGGSSSGRSNPQSTDTSERTESNLSDQSARSALSMISARSGAASVARTLSNASAAIMASFTNPFNTPNTSPVRERHQLSLQIPPGQSLATRGSGESIGNGPRTNADADSFKTAKSSFAKLQAEGEALLGGRPQDVDDLPAPSNYPSSPSSDKESPNQVHTPVDFYPEGSFEQPQEQNQPTTPLHQNPETLRRLTHAASSDTLDLSTPVDNSFATQDRSKSSGSGVGIGESTSGSRPSTGGDNVNPPRRANSDASFWKSKRGSKAWSEDPASPMWPSDRRDEGDWAVATPDPGKSRESLDAYQEGEDWDVEAAAEGRVVQVMFTVPRQPLRVVNVDSELGSGETSDEAKGSRVPSGSKGKQRVERLGADDESISSPPAAIAAADDLLLDLDKTPTPKGKARATLQPPLELAPPPKLRPRPAAITSSSPPPDMRRPGSLPDLQPLYKPPPVSPAFPPPDSEDEEPLVPPPSLSQLTRSSGVTSSNTAASLISPYGTNPRADSSSTLGTTMTAPETPTSAPMRGRPSEKNLRELRREREDTRSRSRKRGLVLTTPPVNRQSLERPGLGERSKSKTSVRSEGGGSVKDLIKEIELRNRG